MVGLLCVSVCSVGGALCGVCHSICLPLCGSVNCLSSSVNLCLLVFLSVLWIIVCICVWSYVDVDGLLVDKLVLFSN